MKTGPKLQPRMIKTPPRAISHTAATNRKTRDGLIGTPPTIFTRRRALRLKNAFLTMMKAKRNAHDPPQAMATIPTPGLNGRTRRPQSAKAKWPRRSTQSRLIGFGYASEKNPIRSVLWSIRGKKLSCLAVVVAKHTADSVLWLRNPLCVAYSYLTRATCNVRCQQITTV